MLSRKSNNQALHFPQLLANLVIGGRSTSEHCVVLNFYLRCSLLLAVFWLYSLQDEIVSNHDELMCNFFAQADALAYGKSREELRSQNVPDYLIPHRSFTGNRPSTSLLLPELSAYTVGQLLSLYEHQVAVQVSCRSIIQCSAWWVAKQVMWSFGMHAWW